MPRNFIFAAQEPDDLYGEPRQITEAEVCGSGFAVEMEAIIGDLVSIGMPAEEICRHVLDLGLPGELLRPLSALCGLLV